MKEIGKTTDLMGRESTFILMELRTLENGWMTSKMDLGKKNGLMGLATKEVTNKVLNKAMGLSCGQTAAVTMANSNQITLKALVIINGQTEGSMRGSGKTTK